eukprot:TRINITY_DN13220_c0_g1_i1.p1 TRINITY_DN13220_c0_g1~~TRINITY_DN13220_c0_g1_i1.p1  ORF type:complete len:629 (+),score=59.89 TRINITY_DN13220_c0_g1_i1:318-2204(+)
MLTTSWQGRVQGNHRQMLGPVSSDYKNVSPDYIAQLYADGKLTQNPINLSTVAPGTLIYLFNTFVQPAAAHEVAVMRIQKIVWAKDGPTVSIQWITYIRQEEDGEVLCGLDNVSGIAVHQGTIYWSQSDPITKGASGSVWKFEAPTRLNKKRGDIRSAVKIMIGLDRPQQVVFDAQNRWVMACEEGGQHRVVAVDESYATFVNRLRVLYSAPEGVRGFAFVNNKADLVLSLVSGRIVRVHLETGRMLELAQFKSPWFITPRVATRSVQLPGAFIQDNPALLISDYESGILYEIDPDVPGQVAKLREKLQGNRHQILLSPTCIIMVTESLLLRLNLVLVPNFQNLFAGIGHVPIDKISTSTGLATTDPGYFFQVKDAPFGSVLNIMINHDYIWSIGGRYYRFYVGFDLQSDVFNDYLWSPFLNQWVLTAASTVGNRFRVRYPWQNWYNDNLGYRLDTRGFPDGPYVLRLRIYDAAKNFIRADSRKVQFDNTWPYVNLDEIFHHANGVATPIDTCGLVSGSSDQFTFNIYATDSNKYLRNWSLYAVWGDNKSKGIASDHYNNHVDTIGKWQGTTGIVPSPVPWSATVTGDPSSRYCAHTFILYAWDRATNGYSHIHHSSYTKSVTLLLDP